MSVSKTIEKKQVQTKEERRERLVKMWGDMVFVHDCKHDYQTVKIEDGYYQRTAEKCSKCRHEKEDWGCVTQGLCDLCEKYSCRRCNEVIHCSLCDRVLCDDCVKKRYCICKTTPYCFECLEQHGGFCSQYCRREDRGYIESEDESSNFNSEYESESESEEMEKEIKEKL
jgi:hypothetical protein